MLKNTEQKIIWLKDLAEFIVEANKNTWAADAPKVVPQKPGYDELEYKSTNGVWLLRDSYTGYFRAPGMTTVYYKGVPAWSQAYGGQGMSEDQYAIVQPTFQFLKTALMMVVTEMPFRGPKEFTNEDWCYSFTMQGTLEDCTWIEKITKNDVLTFTQIGFAGIVIQRTPARSAQFPWEL